MREFASAWPQVEVRLEESADDGELMRMVEFGVVDLTFMSFPVADGPFATTELLRDPYVLVVPRDSPFVGRPEPPTLREIAKLPLIGYRGSEGHDALQTRLLARGIEARIVFRSDDNGTVHGLVAEGFGAALIPRLSVDRHRDDVRALELGSRFTPRLIGMAWHRDRTSSRPRAPSSRRRRRWAPVSRRRRRTGRRPSTRRIRPEPAERARRGS
jgi:DNA-binding transcriptional LysR family regulator